MPDPARKSVSASQMAALFNLSPYCTQYMLWHHFKSGAPLPEPTHSRIGWGVRLQQAILDGVADRYQLAIESNLEKAEYVRRGHIGHTRDGLMRAADIGHYVVEAKNVDWLIWKQTWSETGAPQHIEIQLQTGIYADKAGRGIIGCLVGGNQLLCYEREPDREFCERMEERVFDFFDSLAKDREPEPAGEPIELPMFAHLYPTADPETVIEDLVSKEKRDLLREFRYARDQASFWELRAKQVRPKVEALAKGAGIVRVNGLELRISKHRVAASLIERETYIQTRFRFIPREGDPAIPDDDIIPEKAELAP